MLTFRGLPGKPPPLKREVPLPGSSREAPPKKLTATHPHNHIHRDTRLLSNELHQQHEFGNCIGKWVAVLHEPQGSSRGPAPCPKPHDHPNDRGREGGCVDDEVQEHPLTTKGSHPALLFLTTGDCDETFSYDGDDDHHPLPDCIPCTRAPG